MLGGAITGAGHVRAAAATAIAFLACHPIGAKGDECMWGPYRVALLEAGALRVLLEAALAPTEDDNCRKVIEKAAAVGVMYLCTVVSHLHWVFSFSKPNHDHTAQAARHEPTCGRTSICNDLSSTELHILPELLPKLCHMVQLTCVSNDWPKHQLSTRSMA